MELRTKLCLVMHRDEVRKTTNTGHLAARCLTGSEIHVHGHQSDPLQCPDFAGHEPLLLFPDESAEILTPEHAADTPVTLLVPDATWRQAAKMCRRLPWLAKMRRIGLPPGEASMYRLRSENKPGGLATAEAIARAFGILEGAAVQHQLEHILQLMVERTLFSRGDLARHEVHGGLPNNVYSHDPLGL